MLEDHRTTGKIYLDEGEVKIDKGGGVIFRISRFAQPTKLLANRVRAKITDRVFFPLSLMK